MSNWPGSWSYSTPPPTLIVFYQNRPVAELKKEKSVFYFRYLDDFFTQGLSPLPGLEASREYVRFSSLPAFFRERLPDTRRPEIRQAIMRHRIDENDDLQMLAKLGKHSVTDSFELKLSA